ncbi:MAG: AraC family transcriptional regulator [Candidatus Methylacidiphilales bacterium]|nr:AraC family transcriptional regulator [Candidatus Methylacidiphilales bacterium]
MIRLINTPRIYHCEPDWAWGPRPFTDFDLWIVMGGSGEMRIVSKGAFSLSAGHAFIFGPGTRLSARHDPAQPLRVFACHFMPRSAEMIEVLTFSNDQTHFHTAAVSLPMISMMAEECSASALESNSLHTRSLLQAMVLHVMHSRRRAALPPGQARVVQCVQDIRCAPGQDWQPTEMARSTGFSVPQFNRHFRILTQQSPRQYVIQCRMERAVQLLQESQLSIQQIADALGYSDIFFFHRQFRQVTGTTPGSFRSPFGATA